MGFSAKPRTESPIGFFGTGMKFALATLARAGKRVEIETEGRTWRLEKRSETIRGVGIERLVLMSENQLLALPFSTDLGKTWDLSMAYRELASNTRDEGGEIGYGIAECHESESQVRIWGFTSEAQEAEERWFFNPTGAPLVVAEGIELWPGPSQRLTYRDVTVAEVARPFEFHYNITRTTKLTEDRTLDYASMMYAITGFWERKNSRLDLAKVLARTGKTVEGDFLTGGYFTPSETSYPASRVLLEAFESVWKTEKEAMNKGALETLLKYRKSLSVPEVWEPVAAALGKFARVEKKLKRGGIYLGEKLRFGHLPAGTKVTAREGNIWIGPEALELSEGGLARELLLEWAHLEPEPSARLAGLVVNLIEEIEAFS